MEMIWAAAPTFKAQLAVLAILLQMVITIWCYMRMSKARVAAVKAGKITPDIYKAVGDEEPEDIRVFTRLVANQFELPILFYGLVITGLALGVTSWFTIILAAGFLALRYLHASEMMGEHRILRRRKLFLHTVRIVMLLMLDLALSTLIWL